MKTLWKSMKAGMLSGSGDIGPWKVGEWRTHPEKLAMCKSGFHASENVIDAMGYVTPGIIAEVEVRGEHLEQDDKQVWSEMRVLRAWEWTKEDSVSLAVFAAAASAAACAATHAASAASAASAAAAYAAARAKNRTLDKVEAWTQERIKTLKEVKL